jgi:uncharacterized membrane protein
MNDTIKQEKKNILNVYALFMVSVILSVVPTIAAAGLSLVFFAALMVMAYRYRGACEEHSLQHNHMVYMVRTIWIAGLIVLITMSLAGIYIFTSIKPDAFQPCALPLLEQGMAAYERGGMDAFYALARPCMPAFLQANYIMLLIASLIAAAPVLGYLAYRLIKGLNRAVKGYRLANPKAWL